MKKQCIRIGLFLLLLTMGSTVSGQEKRDLLTQRLADISEARLISDSFQPYHPYSDRQFWDNLPGPIREDLLRAGEKSLGYQFGSVPLTTYLEYKRTGDRMANQAHYTSRRDHLRNLVLAELAEGKGRFMDAIVNGVWSLMEQSSWAISAHLSLQKAGVGVPDCEEHIIDLTVGEIANLISWSYYFFNKEFDLVSPLINKRIRYEMEQRIFEPYLSRDDFWWQGFTPGRLVNNWNPWCNFNVLTSALLVSDDAGQKEEIIRKTMRSTDQFINYYKSDGGCEEGPSYWDHAAGKLLEYLELVDHATDGKVNLFNENLIRRMGEYIALSHIGNEYYLNFADATAYLKGMPDIIYRYGNSTGDENLKRFAAYVREKQDAGMVSGTLDAILMRVKIWDELGRQPAVSYCPEYFWLEGTEIAGVRSKKGSTEGFFFGAKGGYNDESHNHNDVGTFILYYNADPILVDAGVGTYTAKTFSKDRYDIWTMQSGYHNLPTINGAEQQYGREFKSSEVKFENRPSFARFSLDISTAYPDLAACDSWIRTYEINRNTGLTISDNYSLKESKEANRYNFLVAKGVEEISAGRLRLKGSKESLVLNFDPRRFSYVVEEIKQEDPRLAKVWGDALYRLILIEKERELKANNKFTITKN